LAFATPASAAPTSVTVVRGNTLSGLAQRWCGSASKYVNLAAGNGIANPNRIYVGQKIKLTCTAPARTTGNAASRSTTTAKPIPASGWVNPLPGVNLTSCWGDGRGHKGIDMDGYMGQPVRAASAGVVSRTGQIGSGYGNEIMIAHSSVWTHYAHLSRIYVRPGQRVTAGQVIGAVGNSGQVVRSRTGDGSHLHFEIATKASVFGSQVNPAPFLRAHGVRIGC
jgi:murein DD-endopeptidase MepM/ murein hydrolase activator NlpD